MSSGRALVSCFLAPACAIHLSSINLLNGVVSPFEALMPMFGPQALISFAAIWLSYSCLVDDSLGCLF
jgi:hypothetical protein